MAQFFDIDQNTEAWFDLRLGKPTASCFGMVLTATGKRSEQAKDYMYTLASELITGCPQPRPKSLAMEDGKEEEPFAILHYAAVRGVEVRKGGFWLDDSGSYGASPDGLIGQDGSIEAKCPQPKQQLINVLANKIQTAHIPQVQGQMLTMGTQYVDWVSYRKPFPTVFYRVERDDAYISLLDEALKEFCYDLQTLVAKIKSM